MQGLIPAEYPVSRSLEGWWRNPRLYFSTIPRDVIEYCVAPYLSYQECDDLVGQAICPTPILVGQAKMPPEVDILVMLNNGCFLGFPNSRFRRDLAYVNPRANPPTVVWLVRSWHDYSYRYLRSTDCLHVEDELRHQHRIIHQMSQRCTPELFSAAFSAAPITTDKPVLPIDPFFQLHKRSSPEVLEESATFRFQSGLLTVSLISLNVQCLPFHAVYYYGGYLVLLLYSTADNGFILQYHQIIQSTS